MSTERPMPPANLPAYVTGPIERQGPDTLEAQDLEGNDLASDDEEIVDVEENEGGTIVVKKVPCGKDCDIRRH